MPNIKHVEISDERELDTIFCDNILALEDGFVVIQRQFLTESGPIDILALDSDNNFVVIEIKIKGFNEMLMKALR